MSSKNTNKESLSTKITIFGTIAIFVLTIGYHFISNTSVTRNFGGASELNLECNEKLVTIDWKGNNLWVLTRPMKTDEKPEVWTLRESSSLGILEGTVTIKECHK